MHAEQVIDQIYEAAFVPEQWEHVCDSISSLVSAFSMSLITAKDQSFRCTCSAIVRDDMERFFRSPLRLQNVRPQRHFLLSPFSFMRDTDLMTMEEIEHDPIYTEFLHPRGLGWTVGDMFQEPSGHTIIFDILRQRDRGPFESIQVDRLNFLRPHLARAATMASRLEFERINAAVQALELAGLPAAVLNSEGKVIAANSLLQAFEPQLAITAYDKLAFELPSTNTKFAEFLNREKATSVSLGCSLPLPRTESLPHSVLHLVPVKGNARDIFSGAAFFAIATAVDRSKVIDAETIQGLFDLTPSEARVARMIALGNDVSAVADELAVSVSTVRTHVKSILGKSGVNRQTDFVSCILGLRTIGD
ncbi:helix-turn-helix transcriptional regulator [Rhizobium sp. LjRoot30]|uniref:helix-turn-helix transcriptional regulator n=1 Tax=Rhizobium sp. LjRoot30 TaxID=3342320 RepID=UPI003ED0F104